MVFTIDIDTGGTLTDGLFTDGTVIKRVKVDTTRVISLFLKKILRSRYVRN